LKLSQFRLFLYKLRDGAARSDGKIKNWQWRIEKTEADLARALMEKKQAQTLVRRACRFCLRFVRGLFQRRVVRRQVGEVGFGESFVIAEQRHMGLEKTFGLAAPGGDYPAKAM
jgi:hypothetical protein